MLQGERHRERIGSAAQRRAAHLLERVLALPRRGGEVEEERRAAVERVSCQARPRFGHGGSVRAREGTIAGCTTIASCSAWVV